jgi:HPt (histidine-containing phosphotransfer) domain-containing protein
MTQMNSKPTISVLDAHVLESLRQLTGEGEPDVLIEVLGLFHDDAPHRLGAILSACTNADANGVYAAAHSLKGAAGNIGANRLQGVCRDIETAARDGDLGAVGALLGALQREATLVATEITALMRSAG